MFAKQIRIPALDLDTAFALVLLVLVAPVLYTLTTGDYPGAALFYGQEEDAPLVDIVLTARENIVAIFTTVLGIR